MYRSYIGFPVPVLVGYCGKCVNIWRTENVRCFSESVIRNHRGPVWRAVTTPLLFYITFQRVTRLMHFLKYICLSLSLMQGLRTNHTLPMNELIVEQFNSKSPPPTTDG